MQNKYFIEKHSVHLWQVFLPDLLPQIEDFSRILNADEIKRAQRFRFDEHRHAFIVARGVLRQILSLYLQCDAETIAFTLGTRGKPYLSDAATQLQFNVSHSHDMAVFALTRASEIGVDIEKIEPRFNEGVAERFFSAEEYAALSALTNDKKISAFYHLWAGKEAIIKALGEGLYAPLSEFSVDISKPVQTIQILHQQKNYPYHLEYFSAHENYQSAFATLEPVKQIEYWKWTVDGSSLRSQ